MRLHSFKEIKTPKASETTALPGWKHEEVFKNGDEFFPALLSAISRATHFIELETFIFEHDILGLHFLEALKQASARGVQVRVMVDGIGSPGWNIKTLEKLKKEGVEARIYHPLPWVWLGLKSRFQLLRYKYFSFFYRQINRRNHRKVCIIDRKTAWVGSLNIIACHADSFCPGNGWRDTGVCVEGRPVKTLSLAFEKSWARAWTPYKRKLWSLKRLLQENSGYLSNRDVWVRLNNSVFLRRKFYNDLLDRIRSARKCVWITNAYFVPRQSLIEALSIAASNGVDVRILIPQKSDSKIALWMTAIILERLFETGIKVFEYKPTVLHAKLVIIDDWATVGSSNLNYRSLAHDLEVDVVVQQPSSIQKLKDDFSSDLAVSQPMTFRRWKQQFWWPRLWGRVFSFLRYWV